MDTLYRTEARIEPGTSATEHVTLYCTWHPSDLATGLHGQVSPLLVSAKKINFEAFTCRHFKFQNSALECTSIRHFHSENWQIFWGARPLALPLQNSRFTTATNPSPAVVQMVCHPNVCISLFLWHIWVAAAVAGGAIVIVISKLPTR